MTRPDAVVDFFIIEANEYIDRLDLLLAPAGSGGPDAQALARQARALRGSATMYRQSAIARLAAGVERVAAGMRDGSLRWDARLRGALVASVDDLRLLVRSVRTWGEAEERRAAERSQELEQLAPPRPTPAAGATSSVERGANFLSGVAVRLADALERLVAQPADRARLSAALDQVRGARGMAALRDAGPLPEVCDAVERAVDALEGGEGTAKPRQLSLLAAAAAVLRRAAADLAAGRRPSASSAEIQRFAAAASALADDPAGPTDVVPIAALFFHGGDGLISAAPNPPSTPRARLRLELVSQAEHLRRLIAEGREATDPIALGRVRRELRSAMRALASSAHSFGEEKLAETLVRTEAAITSLDHDTLERVERIAQVLAAADDRMERVAERVERSTAGGTSSDRDRREATSRPAESAVPSERQAPIGPRSPTPTGKDLYALLESGIDEIGKLRDRPLTPPAPLDTDEIVPIASLLYRGMAALERARILRDEVRASGGTPSAELVDELVDLVALAAAE
jgi:hypothetical protein